MHSRHGLADQETAAKLDVHLSNAMLCCAPSRILPKLLPVGPSQTPKLRDPLLCVLALCRLE